MARPIPIWKPQKQTLKNIERGSYKALRISSSAYISKPEVRYFIFEKFNNTCVGCGTNKYLQIDHIKSVYHCFNNNLILFCNSEQNLQILCNKCNSSKSPN